MAIAARQKTVLLDFGHGGKDPGAIYSGRTGGRESAIIRESADIVRPIGRLLDYRLTRAGQYYSISIFDALEMPSDDVFWPAKDRVAKIAAYDRENPVWLLLSLHANSTTEASASGLVICHYNLPKSSQAFYDAMVLAANADGHNIAGNRGQPIQQRSNLAILKIAGVNELLVELGFLSNSADRELMYNQSGLFAKWLEAGIRGIEGILPAPE